MTREEAKREMLFAKREVVADSWIDKAYDVAIEALSEPESGIIRCKDCLIHGVCRFEQGLGLDGYCSKAERREG